MQKTFIGKLTKWLVPLAAITVLAGWLYVAPPGILGKADSIGYAVCHRISERSFHIGERQLPLCARDTGTFTGAAVGLLFMALVSRKRSGMPPRKLIIPLALFALIWFVDGSNSYLYLMKQTYPGSFDQIPNIYIPNNTLRLLTGSGMGLAMSAMLYPAFNQTVWQKIDPRPALGSWRDLGLLVGAMLVIDLGILTESPMVLYPIAIISPLGVLALLTLIYSMVWVMIMRQENAFDTLRQLWLPLTAGFTMALIMILGIDLFRFWATGTWGGFPMGQAGGY
ncbi:MAG: DUF2085 domain-containing protein [Chloroflexi bacterium]|nr:DUF2085 domain-containing protein [Chloroflexota bacterium]